MIEHGSNRNEIFIRYWPLVYIIKITLFPHSIWRLSEKGKTDRTKMRQGVMSELCRSVLSDASSSLCLGHLDNCIFRYFVFVVILLLSSLFFASFFFIKITLFLHCIWMIRQKWGREVISEVQICFVWRDSLLLPFVIFSFCRFCHLSFLSFSFF